MRIKDSVFIVTGGASGLGAVHGLVGCAGIVMGEKTVGKEGAHALASLKRVIDVNPVGAFNMIRLDGALRMQPK
jgi:NAD(P)-dependent dehydrogenase (short-subunit alcohol dehydrogenase family)